MMLGRKFYKTKPCILFQRGRCPRHNCTFAHGEAELRRVGGSFNGRLEYRGGGDLRDKLDRRYSPRRRYSPGRDPRASHGFRGHKPISRDRDHSISRSPVRRSDGRYVKRQPLEGQSDRSESLKASDGDEDQKKRRASSYDEKDLLEELKQSRSDLEKLDEEKLELEGIYQDKIDEARKLSRRIEDLEKQLSKEQDDCRRFTSKLKKFVKLHGRCLRMHEELKRAQDRFHSFGDQIASDVLKPGGTEEDSSLNIASDVDLNDDGNNSLKNDELQNHVSTCKKRRLYQPSGDEAKIGSLRKKEKHSAVASRSENPSNPDGPLAPHSEDASNKEISALKFKLKRKYAYNYLSHVGKHKKGRSPPSSDKARDYQSGRPIPSTGLAAHAVDDELIEALDMDEKFEQLEGASNREPGLDGGNSTYVPPVPLMTNEYKEYEGDDDEDVDIEKLESEMVDVDTIDVDI